MEDVSCQLCFFFHAVVLRSQHRTLCIVHFCSYVTSKAAAPFIGSIPIKQSDGNSLPTLDVQNITPFALPDSGIQRFGELFAFAQFKGSTTLVATGAVVLGDYRTHEVRLFSWTFTGERNRGGMIWPR